MIHRKEYEDGQESVRVRNIIYKALKYMELQKSVGGEGAPGDMWEGLVSYLRLSTSSPPAIKVATISSSESPDRGKVFQMPYAGRPWPLAVCGRG